MYDLQSIIFWSVFVLLWLVYLFSTYLDIRQHHVYKKNVKLPKEAAHLMDEETFRKSRLYKLDLSNFSFVKGFYSMVQTSAILYFGILPWVWTKCVALMDRYGWDGREYEVTTSLVFFLFSVLFTFFEDLPWSLYLHFVLEERHGFNKQTLGFYMTDQLKQMALGTVIGLPILAAVLHIIHWGGAYFYIYVWTFVFAFTIFMMVVYPDFIAPLFDRYEPLPQGELRSAIEAMAASIEFPLKKLYVVEGSKRSSHSNAYFYGMGSNKRIVLFDTLIEGFVMPPPPSKKGEQPQEDEAKEKKADAEVSQKGCKQHEILAVLGHELGHWKKRHTMYSLGTQEVNLFILFFAFGQIFQSHVMYSAFGFPAGEAPAIMRLLVAFMFIFTPYNTLQACFMTWLTRKFEFQADRYAAQEMGRGEALKTALIKLGRDNLTFPVNDHLYSAFNFDHPPTIERLHAIDECMRKAQ